MDLRGKTALITGASKRIGREISLALARRGTNILIHYNRSFPEAASLRKEVERLGVQAAFFQADFSLAGKLITRIKKWTKEIHRSFPAVDILVNNASIFYPTPFGRIREETWDGFIGVNLKIPFFLAQEFGLRMVRRGYGKIINLTDWTTGRPSCDYLPYAVSKAGLVAATRGLAKSLGPQVQVNAIAPGPILPPEGMSPSGQKKAAAKTVLKRFGSPQDIAETVCFLCEGTDYITGAVIPVEGGALIL